MKQEKQETTSPRTSSDTSMQPGTRGRIDREHPIGGEMSDTDAQKKE